MIRLDQETLRSGYSAMSDDFAERMEALLCGEFMLKPEK